MCAPKPIVVGIVDRFANSLDSRAVCPLIAKVTLNSPTSTPSNSKAFLQSMIQLSKSIQAPYILLHISICILSP